MAACQQVLELMPNYPIAQFLLGLTYMAQGRAEQSIEELERGVVASGGMVSIISALGCAYAQAGQVEVAQAILTKLQKKGASEYTQPGYLAVIYAALRQTEQAFAWLQKAYEERHGFLIYLAVDPAFDPLRKDARFADFFKRLNLA